MIATADLVAHSEAIRKSARCACSICGATWLDRAWLTRTALRIDLSASEAEFIERETRRSVENTKARKDRIRYIADPEERIRNDVLAFGAERAVSIATGERWHGIRTDGSVPNASDPDVGTRTQVRRNGRFPEYWDTRIYREAIDDQRYVSVVGGPVSYLILGWIMAADAKRSEWWIEPPAVPYAAYFVPPEYLRPINGRKARP